MPEENRFHLSIGSRFENIELVQVVLKNVLIRLGVDEDHRQDVDLAVEGEDLVIRVQDEGTGFNPDYVPNPLDPEYILRPNGRGILFMKKFMDDINYGSAPGGGTLVTLRKRLPGPQADPQS